jgi:DeoR family transcriptional regulator, fructose operon transcriptional repressor
MLKVERQAKIIQFLRDRDFIENSELAKAFNVTLATVRRDLKALDEQGLIVVDHGGISARGLLNGDVEPAYETKVFVKHEVKKAIGVMAVKSICDGDTVILDSGTTSLEIARQMRLAHLKNLTVITCDIMVAKELCPEKNMNVIVLGGLLRKSFYSLYGPYTELILKQMHANKAFMGIDAASIDAGITNIVLEEVPIKQLMIEISDEIIMASDSSKFGKTAPHRVCAWSAIDKVITDECASQEYLDFFNVQNIQVQTVAFIENLSR